MKKTLKAALCSLLASVLLIGLFSGCSNARQNVDSSLQSSSQASGEESGKPDISKEVELQVFLLGDAPKDLEAVSAKINELTKRDLNATVKFNFSSWTDYIQKYNLLLTSGQSADLMYSANWVDYATLSNKGAFLALDEMLPKAAPGLYKFVSNELWDQVKVNGKIYAVPPTWKQFTNDGILYRKDLQKEFNLPVPDSLENVEAYLEGVKKNMPTQAITAEYVLPGLQTYSFNAFPILQMKKTWVTNGAPYGLSADYNDPSSLKTYWGSDAFIEDMKMFKRWADKGFWSKSALSDKTDQTAFENGKVVAVLAGNNPNKYADAVAKIAQTHPDWEVGYISYAQSSKVSYQAHATNDGTSIPASAKNPERALMLLEKMTLDKEYNRLIQYGILGTHYTEEGGYYTPVGDAATSAFPREGMNAWNLRNPEYMLFPKSSEVMNSVVKELETIAAGTKFKGVNIYGGFNENYTNYQSERAALGTVLTQYLAPLQAGLVEDVDAAAAVFMKQAKTAGLSKIQQEYTAQWEAYCAEHQYK